MKNKKLILAMLLMVSLVACSNKPEHDGVVLDEGVVDKLKEHIPGLEVGEEDIVVDKDGNIRVEIDGEDVLIEYEVLKKDELDKKDIAKAVENSKPAPKKEGTNNKKDTASSNKTGSSSSVGETNSNGSTTPSKPGSGSSGSNSGGSTTPSNPGSGSSSGGSSKPSNPGSGSNSGGSSKPSNPGSGSSGSNPGGSTTPSNPGSGTGGSNSGGSTTPSNPGSGSSGSNSGGSTTPSNPGSGTGGSNSGGGSTPEPSKPKDVIETKCEVTKPFTVLKPDSNMMVGQERLIEGKEGQVCYVYKNGKVIGRDESKSIASVDAILYYGTKKIPVDDAYINNELNTLFNLIKNQREKSGAGGTTKTSASMAKAKQDAEKLFKNYAHLGNGGENIARLAGKPNANMVYSGWMQSEMHRNNFHAMGDKEIGVGMYYDNVKGVTYYIFFYMRK